MKPERWTHLTKAPRPLQWHHISSPVQLSNTPLMMHCESAHTGKISHTNCESPQTTFDYKRNNANTPQYDGIRILHSSESDNKNIRGEATRSIGNYPGYIRMSVHYENHTHINANYRFNKTDYETSSAGLSVPTCKRPQTTENRKHVNT